MRNFRYHLIEHAVEETKQKPTSPSHRIHVYKARKEQYRTDNLFRTQPGKIYEELKNLKGNQLSLTSLRQKREGRIL
jgi:hypothetical protein